jgi:lysophospholipase L1-like esterase
LSKKINLITPVQDPLFKDKVYSNSKVLTLGSCFSDNIGNRLLTHSFDTLVNPFGTVFNPISISKLLRFALNGGLIDINELNSIGSRFFHYDFHSTFDNPNPEEVVKKINSALANTRSFIKSMDVLVLTFGTSIVYRLKEDKRIVSNCHKVPNSNFTKLFLDADFMEDTMVQMLDSIKEINPSIKIILTVSPVRHTKEGLVENNISKSRLIELCHRLTKKKGAISYFPAFEIMMDELRDYRYYGPDLIHPNELAIDIIWNRVLESYFDEKSIQKVKDIGKLNLAKNHIPFDPHSEPHLKFRLNQKKKIEQLKVKYPEVDFLQYEQFFYS